MNEEFKTYPKIYALGNDENKDILKDDEDYLVIQEKIDGGNFRFFIKDGKIYFGSHHCELNEEEDDKFFRVGIKYVKDKLQNKDLSNYNNLIFYGEYCVMHSIHYNFDKMPRFLGFDIFDIRENKFKGIMTVLDIFINQLEFTMVPFVKTLQVSQFKEEIKDKDVESLIPKSAYYEGPAEGIVIKNYNKQIFAKIVGTKFKEVNKNAFGLTKKESDTDEELIVATYCQNPRIDKQIFRLIEEGHKLELSMMSNLPKLVYADMVQENWKDLLMSNYSFNLRIIRKIITKRCLAVLKQVIVNNSLK